MFYFVPFPIEDANINIASTWQRYINGQIELKVAFRQQTGNDIFWRKYGTHYGNTQNDPSFKLNDGIIRNFSVPNSDYKSKPSIIASWFEPGQTYRPYDYLILIPHLEPSATSGNMLAVTAKLQDIQIVNSIPGATTTGGNTFIIEGSDVSDFSVTAKPFLDENIGVGYIVYYTYLKNNQIYYRADRIFLNNSGGIERSYFDGDPSNYPNPLNISANNQNLQERHSPDISLRNGKPVIAYQGYKAIQHNVQIGEDVNNYFTITLADYPIIVKYKYTTTNNGEAWSNNTYFNSSGHIQKNPNVEGNKNYGAYLLNFSFDNNQYRQFVYTTVLGSCSPYTLNAKDAKFAEGSFSGSSSPNYNSRILKLSQNGSLYDLEMQQLTANYAIDPGYMDNLIGIIREQNMNYSFNLGPVVAKNIIDNSLTNETSITNLIEFNNNMVSAPFSLDAGDTLIVGGNGYYTYVAGEQFNEKRYCVNLIRKSNNVVFRTLFYDTIHVNDTIESEYLRGYIFSIKEIPTADSFYVQLILDSNSLYQDDQNFTICNVYSPDELYGEGDNSHSYKRKVFFQNGNNGHNQNLLPEVFSLSQNYPNPFNPVTNIKYQLPKDGFVTLKIYDITGREIAKLVNESKRAGYYTVSFNGSNFASGVYFYRIQSGDFTQVKKMVLIK